MRPFGVAPAVLVTALVLGSMSANVSADDPYVESTEYGGYLACSVATPVVKVAACALTANTPVSTFDSFLFEGNVSAGIQELVVGMRWSPSTPVGEQLNLIVEDEGCVFNACDYVYANVESTSPIVIRITDDDITDPDFLWSNVTDHRAFQMRVFAGGDAGLFVDQHFEIYVHEFYHQTAPEGFDPFPAA